MIRKTILAAAAFALSAQGATAWAAGFETVRTASGRTITALPGQVIVKYREGAVSSGQARLGALGAQARGRIASLNLELVSVPGRHTVETFLALLRSNPDVEFAEPNGVLRALAFPEDEPNDGSFPAQYALDYTGAANINIDAAWQISLGDPSVIVAVVDTGVNLANTDFDANSLVTGTTTEIDWFGDGDCTDVAGPELTFGPDQCAGIPPEDDNNIPDDTYHGTRVSGIIAATANNGNGIAGVAPDCRIMPVKVLNSWGFGTTFSIANGITFAANNGAAVINLSLGSQASDATGAIQLAVAHALDRNCVVVAASGNSGNQTNVNFPASLPGVIAVGAVNQTNALASFSATGKALDLVAPGVFIEATVPTGTEPEDGTSFSAPYVAGVAALVRSVRPGLAWNEVVKYIDFTATDLGAGGFDNNFGFGRLNAGAAVAAAQAGTTFFSNPASPGETFPYPNPFRPATGAVVTISLPESLGSDGIEIDIRNIAGETIKTITGTNVWDGRNDDGDLAAAGLYFYVAKTSRGDAKGKLTLVK